MLTAIGEAENLGKIEKYSGWRLHRLTGDRQGTWSMVVTRKPPSDIQAGRSERSGN
jgi:hypothetical protein